jgi:hypothetical protein
MSRNLDSFAVAYARIALLNGVRELVDAGVPMSPEVAEQALIARIAGSAPSDAVAREVVAEAGGWLGCVRSLCVRMRGKAFSLRDHGEELTPTVCHTLCEAGLVLQRAGLDLPGDAEAQAVADTCIVIQRKGG